MSDCVLLDNTVQVITLDETVDEPESGEDVSQDSVADASGKSSERFSKVNIMTIRFSNDVNMQQFGPELIEFMQQRCNDLGVDLKSEEKEISFFQKVIDLDAASEDDTPMFTIDSTPSKGNRPASGDVPRYNTSISETLSNERNSEKSEGRSRRSISCFNCDGEHNLRDCPEPRNQQRINANRKSKQTKAERYHVDLSQKYGHLRPGQISSRLQKALGLKSKDLPVHVFRMRKLGYPPGWLEEAKVSHSGINLFGSDGTAVLESDDEEGEVEQMKDKYDAEKVIEYPGFNVDAPEGSFDDAQMFSCPAMQEEHRKENFLANLGVNVATAYKRRKMNSFPMNDSDLVGSGEDMDIAGEEEAEEEDGEIKDNNSMLPPPPPAPAVISVKDTESEGPATGVNDSLIDFIATRDEEEEKKELERSKEAAATENKDVSISGDSSKSVLVSKEMVEGTPLLKSASSFDKLPDGDKWAVGVSDVINFENLPDSVGKYEKMKVLIKKVQKVVKQIHSE